jgi:signal transduction histidine kinase
MACQATHPTSLGTSVIRSPQLSRRTFAPVPSHSTARGLVPALWSLSDRFESVLSLEYNLDNDLENAERSNSNYLSEQIKVTLYRIVENALTNAVKHAEAKTVTVQLQWDPRGELSLSIQDVGTGFDIGTASMGTGLGTMQDYAQSIDGSREIRSVPGEGTTITATIPIPAYTGA